MKYEIYMESVWPRTATLIIEADDEEKAEEIALAMDSEGEIDWTTCDSDCIRVEIVEISQYEGEDDAENE